MNLAHLATAGGNWDLIQSQLPTATLETLLMIVVATIPTAVIGLAWGLANHAISPDGLRPVRSVYQVSSLIVNIGRSMPFIILAAAILPFTRFVVGTSIGWQAAIVPTAVCAIPFYARLVENSAREVSAGKIEAALMSGASRLRVIRSVIFRESLPGLVSGLTITMVALISCTATAGAIGAGGLGQFAINYGYNRFMGDAMLAAIIAIVVIVEVIQLLGDLIARQVDHRR